MRDFRFFASLRMTFAENEKALGDALPRLAFPCPVYIIGVTGRGALYLPAPRPF